MLTAPDFEERSQILEILHRQLDREEASADNAEDENKQSEAGGSRFQKGAGNTIS